MAASSLLQLPESAGPWRCACPWARRFLREPPAARPRWSHLQTTPGNNGLPRRPGRRGKTSRLTCRTPPLSRRRSPSLRTGVLLLMAACTAALSSRPQAFPGHLHEVEAGLARGRLQEGAGMPPELEDVQILIDDDPGRGDSGPGPGGPPPAAGPRDAGDLLRGLLRLRRRRSRDGGIFRGKGRHHQVRRAPGSS